jgi:hypothetical protein
MAVIVLYNKMNIRNFLILLHFQIIFHQNISIKTIHKIILQDKIFSHIFEKFKWLISLTDHLLLFYL